MKQFIMTCGNIGTGKSTTVKQIISSYADGDFVKFAVDDIALALNHGRYSRAIWSDKHRNFYDLIKSNTYFFGSINNLDIIFDDPHMSIAERMVWLSSAKEDGYRCILIVHKNDEALERRLKSDNRGYTKQEWEEVYNYFASIWEEPTENEGWDKITRIVNNERIQ